MARLANIDDVMAVAGVHVRAWQHTYRGVMSDEFLDSLDVERRAEVHTRTVHNPRTALFVAERDGVVVGFSMLGPSIDERWGELLAIYAEPTFIGTGVGHELMGASVDWFTESGYARALLWVLDTNKRARDFYEREGWSLARAIKVEPIGGVDITHVRYEKDPLETP